MRLRYGINPHQPATCLPLGRDPIQVLHGEPSYTNLLDALNGWQLVHLASRALERPVAASFKHVSPAGVATDGPLDEVITELYGTAKASPIASAYLRARDADPRASYGDFAIVSHPVDDDLATLLGGLVSDGIIAPGFEPGTVAKLSRKKQGRFVVIAVDEKFTPPSAEVREIFGLRLIQSHAPLSIPRDLPPDVILGLATMRYTQSDAVCYVRDGVTIGVGAGQQSRIDCTRLAGSKARIWWLRRHPALAGLFPEARRQDRINQQISLIEDGLALSEAECDAWTLDGVTYVSDGALPYRDNVDLAARHGVELVAEPGGSIRSPEVEAACREHGITLLRTSLRLFHH